MKTLHLLLAAALMCALTAPASAHEGHKIFGFVVSVQEDTLTMRTTEGKEEHVRLAEDTQFEKDGMGAKRTELVPGRRIVVYMKKDHSAAERIKIGN